MRFSEGRFLLLQIVVDDEYVVLHLLPHWNWPGKEGQEICVDALSNCKQVELFFERRVARQTGDEAEFKIKLAGEIRAGNFERERL